MYDTVIIDTAGRLGVDERLMQQDPQYPANCKPSGILFVIDAMIGQGCCGYGEAFDEALISLV